VTGVDYLFPGKHIKKADAIFELLAISGGISTLSIG
jgi:hypothetical protein